MTKDSLCSGPLNGVPSATGTTAAAAEHSLPPNVAKIIAAMADGIADDGADENAMQKARVDAACALASLRAAGFVVIPREPTSELLMSMALRADHGLAVPGYYDRFAGGHARRMEQALIEAGRQHEEVVGDGFYHPERAEMYRVLLEATPVDMEGM